MKAVPAASVCICALQPQPAGSWQHPRTIHYTQNKLLSLTQAPEEFPVGTDVLSLYYIGASFSVPWERYQEKAATATAAFIPVCPSGGLGEEFVPVCMELCTEWQLPRAWGDRSSMRPPCPAPGHRAACPAGTEIPTLQGKSSLPLFQD